MNKLLLILVCAAPLAAIGMESEVVEVTRARAAAGSFTSFCVERKLALESAAEALASLTPNELNA